MTQSFYDWLRDKVWHSLEDFKDFHPNPATLVDEKINLMDNVTLLEYFDAYEKESMQ